MKKIIQLISFVFIAVVVSVVSVKAQAAQKFEANIPFSFSVAGKTYDAGNYKVKIAKPFGSAGIMTIWNGDGKVLGMFNVTSSGESTANESKFIFDRSGDDRTLTRIVTTETSFDVPRVNTKRRAVLAEKRQPKINNN
jgi:hypothetical protein